MDKIGWPHAIIAVVILLIVLIIVGYTIGGPIKLPGGAEIPLTPPSRPTPLNERTQKTLYQISIPLSTAISQDGSGVSTCPLGELFDQTPSDPEVNGIKFRISSDSPVIETESQNFPNNPAIVYIPIRKTDVVRIHLLMNMSYGAPKWVEWQEIAGKNVAKVWFISNQKRVYWKLEAGRDIREWVILGVRG